MPINRPSTAAPVKPKTPTSYAANALNATAGADETDLLPGDRARAVKVKPPPIQGNEASTTYTGPQLDKGGNQIPPNNTKGPPLIQPYPTPTPPAARPPAAPPPGNDIVIRQYNNNRGIPNSRMNWDPATQSLYMDNRPVFQVGRNMSIDPYGNGVTDLNTWQQAMNTYGYGEQNNTNIPDYQRRLMAGADTTRDPSVYWNSAEGQAARQQILQDRQRGLIEAKNAAAARGASPNSGTYARFMGNVYGTEQQALVDAAPKLMDATRRSYLDVLNSDVLARQQANAQEVAQSNATGMYRGQMTYPAQKDYLAGVMDIANQRETMPYMNTGMLANPGLQAVGGQINDIAGQMREPVRTNNLNASVALEGHRDLAASRGAAANAQQYTADQSSLQTKILEYMTANNISMDAQGLEAIKKKYGAPTGMRGDEALAVIHNIFSGATGAKAPTRAQQRDDSLGKLTGWILDGIPSLPKDKRLQDDPKLRDKILAEKLKQIDVDFKDPQIRNQYYPLTLVEAQDFAKKVMGVANSRYDDSMAILRAAGYGAP